MSEKLMDLTSGEVEAGGLRGPVSADRLSEDLGPLWMAARRFGIVQNQKLIAPGR